ncbi:MAG: exopolysaccharide biosynthesis polyprenyl glycosylphosphotransferase [Anaerolineae bacterium]
MSTAVDRPSAGTLSQAVRARVGPRFTRAERRGILWLGDIAVCAIAGVLALWLWTFTRNRSLSVVLIEDGHLMLVISLAWLFLAWALELYALPVAADIRAVLPRLLSVAGVVLLGYLVVFFLVAPHNQLIRLPLVYFLLLVTLLASLWRWVMTMMLARGVLRQRALVVGAGWAGRTIARLLREQANPEFEMLGFIDDDAAKQGSSLDGLPVLGTGHDLLSVAHRLGADTIIYAITHQLSGAMFRALLDCQAAGLAVVRMPALYEALTGRVPVDHIRSDWLLPGEIEGGQISFFYQLVVHVMDLTFALLGGILLALLGPLIALLIKLDSPGPVFFRQIRSGRGGVPFQLFKFRSMRTDAEATTGARWATEDDPRITRVGRWLRRTRLDELPQILNILRGDIHLIGPRPERPEFIAQLEKEIPFYRARLAVKPGLTGWAQVKYRYGSTVEDARIKLEYDLYYIKHRSLGLDLQILLQTIGVMLALKGQ